MITVTKQDKSKTLELKYEGTITHEDYEKTLIPALEKELKSEKPLNILCDLRGMDSIKGKAIWDDYKFGIHHLKEFNRIATVGDVWWMAPLMTVSKPFFRNMELRHFPGKDYAEAIKWVSQEN